MYKNKIEQVDKLQEEINAYRPLKREVFNDLKEFFKIGLTYTSNSIEGNSITETETKIILEDGLTIGGKTLREHYEVAGHSEAYNFMYELVENKKIEEKDILNLHRLFYYRIDEKNAGKYRKENVFITGTTFIPPSYEKIPELMKKLVDNFFDGEKKYHPIEYAALLHKELVTIHPFVDGNGRTARLLMNLALLQNGYVVTIIPLIVRNDYITALKKAQVEPKTDEPFINFISCMVYESQKDYLRMLRSFEK